MIRTLVRAPRIYGPLLALGMLGGCSHVLGDYAKPGEVIQANPIVGTDPDTGKAKLLGYGVPQINGGKAATIYNDANGNTSNVATGDTAADEFAKPVVAIGTIVGPALYGAAQVGAAAIGNAGAGIVNNLNASSDSAAQGGSAKATGGSASAQAARNLANYTIPVTGKQSGSDNTIQVVVPGQPTSGGYRSGGYRSGGYGQPGW